MNNNGSKIKIEGDPDAVLRFAYGGKAPDQKLAGGGMAEGPSHEEGGIDAVPKGGDEATAEIEGGERVFSKEDTSAMEQACMQITELQQSGDQAGAEDMAMRLGFAVCNMIEAQEKNQDAQEQQMAGRGAAGGASDKDAAMMNQFGNQPDEYAG